jgi:hypothetical protein
VILGPWSWLNVVATAMEASGRSTCRLLIGRWPGQIGGAVDLASSSLRVAAATASIRPGGL